MVFSSKKDILKLFREIELLKKENSQLKEGYDDILDTTNENTNEIQSNYAFVSEVDKRINKLNDKIEEISMMMKHIITKSDFIDDKQLKIAALSSAEKRIFLLLYTSEQIMAYKDIALSTNMSESLVIQYITSLIEKGVPLVKHYERGKPMVGLSSKFKELQAKNNLVNLG